MIVVVQKLDLGRLVMTHSIGALLQEREVAGEKLPPILSYETLNKLVNRHASGDWGDVDDEDKASNDRALNPENPTRLLSAYTLEDGTKIWIITEWDRSVTTVLLPDDY